MYPGRFEYQRAGSIDEALTVLDRNKDEVKLLAGGQSLIPLMKMRLASPQQLLDIGRLSDLFGIRGQNGLLRIGALTRHVDLEQHSAAKGLELLPEAARVIGDPQVRNLGTVGGALAEADPAGDWGAVFLALESWVVCRSLAGERKLAVKDFFIDAYTTALKPEEILTEVQVAVPSARSASAYLKLERKSGDFAVASAAVVVQAGIKNRIEKIGIGLSGVGLTPVKAANAESVLKDREASPELLDRAGEALMSEIAPLSDLRGSSDYKREVAKVIFCRAFNLAWERARRKEEQH